MEFLIWSLGFPIAANVGRWFCTQSYPHLAKQMSMGTLALSDIVFTFVWVYVGCHLWLRQ